MPAAPHGVFISYRRADTAGHAGRLGDELERHFGYPVAFHDIDSIAAGADFVVSLQQALARARVCIVLIGDTWLSAATADGGRRLDDPQDFVRQEVEMALAREGMLVLPVLVEGARMPLAEQLPASLQPLARRQALELSESRWSYDLEQLVAVLQRAGIDIVPPRRWRRRVLVAAAMLATAGALAWWSGDDPLQRYAGVWYLPNGSFWTVQLRDAGLWVEETHYESREVWQRGAGQITDAGVDVALDLVFQQEPFQYLYTLRLSDDGQWLQGSVRRSDRPAGEPVTLSRVRP